MKWVVTEIDTYGYDRGGSLTKVNGPFATFKEADTFRDGLALRGFYAMEYYVEELHYPTKKD